MSPTVTALVLIFFGIPSGTWACRVFSKPKDKTTGVGSILKRCAAYCVVAAIAVGLIYTLAGFCKMLGLPEVPAG
ncbi:MAG TPA: hypothetical protein PLP17_03205 [Oligoflexia bacterium]|nr:hypothetical protein [Oligoflexia bacterium]